MPHSIIRLEIQPGANKAFEKAFVESGMLSRPKAIDTAFEGKLLRCASEPSVYYVVATWSAPERYDEWQQRSREGADPAVLAIIDDLLIDPIPGRFFDVAASS